MEPMCTATTNNSIRAMEYRNNQFKQKMGWDAIRYRCLLMSLDMAKDNEQKKKATERLVEFLREE